MGYGDNLTRTLGKPGWRTRRKRYDPIVDSRVLHVSEADAVRDLAAVLRRVQAGTDIVIERDAQPLAVIRAAAPAHRKISECIALAEAHERESGQAPRLDPDFASDVEEIIGQRKPRNPGPWA